MTLPAPAERQGLLWLFSGLTPSWHRSGGGGGGEGRDVQNQALLLSQALPGVAPQVDLGAGSVSCLLPFLTLSSALQPPEPVTRLGGWWLTDQSRGRKHSFLARQVWLHVPALPLSSSMT